jgi:energy-coupling factor transporter ATP-binding protein EcfA2
MKKLVFKEVSILSKIEKAAWTEKFEPAVNLLTGENDVGKSTLIKSLYHTLGADVPGLQNARWKNAKPIYCVRFEFEEREYIIIRDEKYFGVFDAKEELLGRYVGISGARGISRFMNPLLDFRIELERADTANWASRAPRFTFFASMSIKMKAGPRVGLLSADCSSSVPIGKTCLSITLACDRSPTTTQKGNTLS